MAKETTYEEIARNLKNKIYAPVYFLMGEEDYYIDRIADYILEHVLTETEKRNSIKPSYMALILILPQSLTRQNAIQ